MTSSLVGGGPVRYVVCLTTLGSRRAAEKVARHLVSKKVVACVSVIPGAVSFFHWKKKLCRKRESLLLMKTTQSGVKRLEKELHRVHPYDLPEFVVLPVQGGSQSYLDWLKQGVTSL